MASGTLRISSNFGNPYEEARERLKFNPFFNEEHWRKIAQGSTFTDLDMYIAALKNSNKITDLNKFYKDYNDEFSNLETHVGALYNEIFADKTTFKKHTRYQKDANGQILLDNNGKPLTEEYEDTDYNYYKSMYKEQNDANYQQWLVAQDKERKDSMNGFVKFLGTVGSIGLDVASGFTETVDGFTSLIGGAGDALNALLAGEDVSDAFVNSIASDKYRSFTEFQDWVVDFERRYTWVRDIDGNYTGWGKFMGSLATTVGQLLPSIILMGMTGGVTAATSGTISKSTGLLSTSALGINTASGVTGVINSTDDWVRSAFHSYGTKATGVVSQSIYYGSMTSNNIKDMYQQFASKNVSVSTEQILLNAAVKTSLEIGVEKILGHFLGGTGLDNALFGKGVKAAKGDSLVKSGLLRVLKDSGHEGLEEVLQELSGHFTDKFFTSVINENFGEITDLTFENLLLSFIIGSIVSFGSSSIRILTSNGEGIANKIKNYEYNLTLTDFSNSYNELMRRTSNRTLTDKEQEKASAALASMYSSYRLLASIYGEIGETKFKTVTQILDTIQANIKSGKYDNQHVRIAARDLYNDIFDSDGTGLATQAVKAEIKRAEEAKITKLADRAIRGEDISDEVDDKTKQEIKQILEAAPEVNQVITTEDGEKPIQIKDAVITPKKLLNNGGSSVVLAALSEDALIDKIINDANSKNIFKLPLEEVLKVYKQIKNEPDATMTDAVRSLLFDNNLELYKTLLFSSNKDMYHLLEGFAAVINNIKVSSVKDGIDKNKITTVFNNMRSVLIDYLKVQFNAEYKLDILTKEQQVQIVIARWFNGISQRVIKGETLTADDKKLLENRVNNMPVSSEEKTNILNYLYSSNSDEREIAINKINKAYTQTYYKGYDGITYMPITSIPNIVFNNYLQSFGLTISL